MSFDPKKPDFTIAVVGAGIMGRGIAQLFAVGGFRVQLFDVRDGAAGEARDFITGMIDRAVAKDRMSAGDGAAASARLEITGAIADLSGADLVCEAIVEQVAPKRALFAELEAVVADDCILATNTSSLSVTEIASGCNKPDRVAGFHFFNPVPLMKVVEVIAGVLTAPAVLDALVTLARKAGHTPVRTIDSPGFLINNAGRGLYTEGVRIVSEGIAPFNAVDDVMREGGPGFRMGPFELLDTTGLDVSHVVMESIYRQYYDEPRFKPQPLTRTRMAAGLYGRKVGRGFYTYEDNKKVDIPPPPVPKDLPEAVWISPRNPDGAAAIAKLLEGRVEIDTGDAPGHRSICITAPLGEDATTTALALGVEAERTVAVDTAFGLDGRITLMTTPVTDPDIRDQAHALFASSGQSVTVIHDSPGFIAQRMLATIVNIGCDIAQNRIAAPDDIEQAVMLGLGYPKGPLALGDALGAAKILRILDALYTFYRDPRYRPSPWLSRRARLGISLMMPEG